MAIKQTQWILEYPNRTIWMWGLNGLLCYLFELYLFLLYFLWQETHWMQIHHPELLWLGINQAGTGSQWVNSASSGRMKVLTKFIYQNIVLWRTLICFNQLSRRCQLGVMDRKPWIWAAYIMSGADIFWCLASGVQIRISLSKKECGAGHSVSFLGIQVLQRTSYWSHLRAQSVESLVFCLLSYTGN